MFAPYLLHFMYGEGISFDGDTVTTLILYNKRFSAACDEVYNPRNAFCISRDDGTMNNSINIFTDSVININALMNLSKQYYTEENKAKIKALKEKYNQMV